VPTGVTAGWQVEERDSKQEANQKARKQDFNTKKAEESGKDTKKN
jgi:hypothetical protein